MITLSLMHHTVSRRPSGFSAGLALSVLFMAVFIGCASYPAASEASTVPDGVKVRESNGSILLLPAVPMGDVGVLFYPGALVAPRAYVPLFALVAEKGVPVLIVKMPFDLAVLDRDAALSRMAGGDFPVHSWVIGGHSLGGAMAAALVHDKPGLFPGLILLAAYPPEDASLAAMNVPVLSLYGSRDGLATPEKIARFRPLLPPDARIVRIEGGNHAQFGSYGPQSGDETAEIPRAEQHRIVAEEILAFLSR